MKTTNLVVVAFVSALAFTTTQVGAQEPLGGQPPLDQSRPYPTLMHRSPISERSKLLCGPCQHRRFTGFGSALWG